MSWVNNNNNNSFDKNFLTNYEPDVDIEMWLRVARFLNIPAWIGENVDGMPGSKGFYVHYSVRNLDEFWEIIRNRQ